LLCCTTPSRSVIWFRNTVGSVKPIGALAMIRYAKIHAVSGRRDEALKIAQNLETRASESSAADSNIALIYVGLGDNDKAMIWLNKAYQARFNPSILLRPAFDPLRSDVRFQDLWRRIGLP
jgi:tetratricopeptide (TPR) repeat protein